MPALAELQARVAAALLGDPGVLPAELFARGPIPPAAALRVHRDTVIGGLVKALRLTFPTVDLLVGETFFDHAASVFAARQPPGRAWLSAYGEAFPDFLQAFDAAAGLPYLADVARLDLAIGRAVGAPDSEAGQTIPLDASTAIGLAASLTALALSHPADLIRDALEANDDLALAAIDLDPRPYWLAVWRRGDTAAVRPLTAPAGVFLGSLLADGDADRALAKAFDGRPPESVLAAIQAEVFTAPFAAISHIPPEGAHP